MNTWQVLISILAAELGLNFVQQRTADLLTPKMLKASSIGQCKKTSLTTSIWQDWQYCNSMFISCSLHLLRLFAISAASPKEWILELHSSAKTVICQVFWVFLFTPFYQEPNSDQSVELSPAFLACFHLVPYPDFDHLTYWWAWWLRWDDWSCTLENFLS